MKLWLGVAIFVMAAAFFFLKSGTEKPHSTHLQEEDPQVNSFAETVNLPGKRESSTESPNSGAQKDLTKNEDWPQPSPADGSTNPNEAEILVADESEAEPPPLNVRQINTADEVNEFLKRHELPDFETELQNSKLLSRRQVRAFNGFYLGRVTFYEPGTEGWDVELKFQARKSKGQYHGEHDIKLIRNGQTFNHTMGTIKSDQYRRTTSDPPSILINISGDQAYFQLYYIENMQQFHGLVYLKETTQKFKAAGVVELTKR